MKATIRDLRVGMQYDDYVVAAHDKRKVPYEYRENMVLIRIGKVSFNYLYSLIVEIY